MNRRPARCGCSATFHPPDRPRASRVFGPYGSSHGDETYVRLVRSRPRQNRSYQTFRRLLRKQQVYRDGDHTTHRVLMQFTNCRFAPNRSLSACVRADATGIARSETCLSRQPSGFACPVKAGIGRSGLERIPVGVTGHETPVDAATVAIRRPVGAWAPQPTPSLRDTSARGLPITFDKGMSRRPSLRRAGAEARSRQPRLGWVSLKLGRAWILAHQSAKPGTLKSASLSGVSET